MTIDWLMQYWWAALLASVAVIVIIWLLLRPRQRVTLTDSTPTRPHMAPRKSDPAQPAVGATTVPVITAAGGDDLTQLKGVGPKLAATLNANGVRRYEDLASLSPDQLAGLDEQLGTFRGRLSRDRVVEQARYLAAGDRAGFEAEFGKL